MATQLKGPNLETVKALMKRYGVNNPLLVQHPTETVSTNRQDIQSNCMSIQFSNDGNWKAIINQRELLPGQSWEISAPLYGLVVDTFSIRFTSRDSTADPSDEGDKLITITRQIPV